MVGNKFRKHFFQYYLTEILKITENTDKFSLHIIDHEVNTVDLDFSDENDHILLDKTGYKVSILNNENGNLNVFFHFFLAFCVLSLSGAGDLLEICLLETGFFPIFDLLENICSKKVCSKRQNLKCSKIAAKI